MKFEAQNNCSYISHRLVKLPTHNLTPMENKQVKKYPSYRFINCSTFNN